MTTDQTSREAAAVTLDPLERLLIALHRSGMSASAFAAHVGVHPVTASRWFTGRTSPSVAAVRILADLAGVPYEWLKPAPGEGTGLKRYTPWDSNPEPTDYLSFLLMDVVAAAETMLLEAVGA